MQIQSNSTVEVTLQIDPEKLREESAIYKNLEPGCFLYAYRKSLNEAAYELAVENPRLLSKKGELQALAKKKVDSDGYLYKKKKSRAIDLSPNELLPVPSKVTPSLRSKRIGEVEEDLKEIKMEMTLIERSRVKARNVDNDERARRLTQEMTPLRERKRKLEDELTLLQKKEAKSLLHKKKRDNKEQSKEEGQPQASPQITIDKLLSRKAKEDLQQKDGSDKVEASSECDVTDVDRAVQAQGADKSSPESQNEQSDLPQQKSCQENTFL